MHPVLEIHKLRKEFGKITGIYPPYTVYPFYIDIVKLDEMLKTPDGTSMNDFLTQKYGKRAAEIIDELCGLMVIWDLKK